MKKILCIAIILSILLLAFAIYNCMSGDLVEGILNFVALGIVVFTVLKEVAFWWKYDEALRKKFTFKCRYCGYEFTPSFWKWLFIPHIGSKRYFRCKACGDRHFMRRRGVIK